MKKLMSIAKKASTALAALALVVATTSVPSACFHWFAQPVEPEEVGKYGNKKELATGCRRKGVGNS